MSDLDQFEFRQFARRPFLVDAVLVTVSNLDDIAKHVGEVVEKEDGTRFIQVDRRKVPNVFRVYPGFFLTRLEDNIRCYSPKVFAQQFIELNGDTDGLVAELNGEEVT